MRARHGTGEPARARPDLPGSTGASRIAAGWQRRFVVDQTRVVEVVRLYRSLGFETAVDPVRPEDLPADEAGGAQQRPDPRCDHCRLVTLGWLHTVYTRPARPPCAD